MAKYPESSAGNNAGEYLGLTDDGGYIVFVDSDSHEIPAPNNFGFLKIEPDTITVSTNIQTLTSADIKQVRNYPNPFKHGTSIEYYISEKAMLKYPFTIIWDLKQQHLFPSRNQKGNIDILGYRRLHPGNVFL